jgi:2-succinyl-5-enolpyruvyl-6-hydroxy-3-cyclohexene-1-carboxylate synthase
LHDSNGLLGHTNRSVDLRIVVVDNRGGGIFSFLPQRASLPPDDFERLFGTPHDTDIALIAEAHGLPAIVVRSTQELRDALQIAGPRVILVRTRRDDNVRVHESIHVNVAQSVRETLRLR